MNTAQPLNETLHVLFSRARRASNLSGAQFAEKMGISKSYLSQVLTGKKKPSLSMLIEFLEKTQAPTEMRKQILKVHFENEVTDVNQKNQLANLLKDLNFAPEDLSQLMKLSQFELLQNWYNIAILELTEISGFQADVDWIAKKLELHPVLVKQSVRDLIRHGLLKAEDGTLKKVHDKIEFAAKASTKSVREFHTQVLKRTSEILLAPNASESFQQRYLRGLTIATDLESFEKIKTVMDEATEKIYSILNASTSKDQLYQVNLLAVPLANSIVPGNKVRESETVTSKEVNSKARAK